MSTQDISTDPRLTDDVQKIIEARHHDPFQVLGRHQEGDQVTLRVFQPNAEEVRLPDQNLHLERIEKTDCFIWQGSANQLPDTYRIGILDQTGRYRETYDPYCFPPLIGDLDLHLFGEGRHWHAYRFMGAHLIGLSETSGSRFVVWAPNAERVSVIGDFNQWDGRVHPMRSRGGSGIWELFIPDLTPGNAYKFEIRSRSGELLTKADPYGQRFEKRPATASLIQAKSEHLWQDKVWTEQRRHFDWQHQPTSIYEVHLGSWRHQHGEFLNYRQLAEQLVEYVKPLGFTHIELLPITEHPLDQSWGYQTTGYFAPTSRFGSPDDFRYFVDYLHQHDIGVILDWVPAHFPRDEHALARFDGTPLYEHADPRKGEHRDWGTLIFNFGRNEVKNFLLANAVYWLEEFHLDGLRVDAVASMLYLDYSREADDWVPNQYGGRENLEAIDFLRELNEVVHERFPGSLVVAEESTAWPQVSRPTWLGGLGFSMKWNMGWMHDTLSYIEKDPIYRHYHHDQLTFGVLYAFSENFVLPFSHDEVVHGKGSMLTKMPGEDWQQFANLRLLYAMQYTYPGKKLNFMGNEFAQRAEWNDASTLNWDELEHRPHQGIKNLIGDLNQLYCKHSALHHFDFTNEGFEWVDCHDSSQSVLAYLRKDDQGNAIAVVLNFTPVMRENYRIGLPKEGCWREAFNSDSEYYGGGNRGNGGLINVEDRRWMGRDYSAELLLPPLSALVLIAEEDKKTAE